MVMFPRGKFRDEQKKKLGNQEVLSNSVWQDASMHKKKTFCQIRMFLG